MSDTKGSDDKQSSGRDPEKKKPAINGNVVSVESHSDRTASSARIPPPGREIHHHYQSQPFNTSHPNNWPYYHHHQFPPNHYPYLYHPNFHYPHTGFGRDESLPYMHGNKMLEVPTGNEGTISDISHGTSSKRTATKTETGPPYKDPKQAVDSYVFDIESMLKKEKYLIQHSTITDRGDYTKQIVGEHVDDNYCNVKYKQPEGTDENQSKGVVYVDRFFLITTNNRKQFHDLFDGLDPEVQKDIKNIFNNVYEENKKKEVETTNEETKRRQGFYANASSFGNNEGLEAIFRTWNSVDGGYQWLSNKTNRKGKFVEMYHRFHQ